MGLGQKAWFLVCRVQSNIVSRYFCLSSKNEGGNSMVQSTGDNGQEHGLWNETAGLGPWLQHAWLGALQIT